MKKIDMSEVITPEEVYQAARETGFVKRGGGKINPFDMLMTLVFRMSQVLPPALSLIISFMKTKVSRSGLHQRFTEKASLFFRRCLQIIMIKRLMETAPLKSDLLERVNRVLVTDSSSWDVSAHLKDIFPGSGGSASSANCKLQFVYDYKSGSIVLLEDRAGTEPDQKYSKNLVSLIQEGDLLIPDLGYWNFETFFGIDGKGGYFISRFNSRVNIWDRRDEKFIKLDLLSILEQQMSNSIEMEVFIRGEKTKTLKIRLVVFRVPEEVANMRRKKLKEQARKKGRIVSKKSLQLCDWSVFVTNASEEIVPGEMIRSIYRVRWCVELIFKSWKSILRMHQSNVRKNHYRLKCELYAKLILAVITHTLHHHLNHYAWNKKGREISFDKLWKFIVARSESLHEAIIKSMKTFSHKVNSLLGKMIKECEKLHQPSRKTTLQMIDEMIGDPLPTKINLEGQEISGGCGA